MKTKEVIEVLKIAKAEVEWEYPLDYEVAIDTAIKTVKKQIPKKPIYEGDGYAPDGTFIWDTWICPGCGKEYEVDYDKYDYCPNCGQAIDWSEEK